ncbi:MAG: glycosyltransferase, partial [Candidatus Micrarchaeaceae archaeon]
MLNETEGVNEVIIVDDGSTYSTIDKIKNFRRRFTVKLIERKRKGDTVSAQIDGARLTSNEYVVVMDADLQHEPTIIPKMLSEATQGYDLVVASRLVEGGVSKRDAIRGMISRGASFLAHLFIPQTNKIKDVMSGYFLAKRDILAELPPVDNSYKLLLYVF